MLKAVKGFRKRRMGGSSSKDTEKANTINETKEVSTGKLFCLIYFSIWSVFNIVNFLSGTHFLEFHMPSMGYGFMMLLALIGIAVLLYRCSRKPANHSPIPQYHQPPSYMPFQPHPFFPSPSAPPQFPPPIAFSELMALARNEQARRSIRSSCRITEIDQPNKAHDTEEIPVPGPSKGKRPFTP